MRAIRLALVALVGGVLLSSAGPAQAVFSGSVVKAKDAGPIAATYNEYAKNYVLTCSGVLIAPSVVLTRRACVPNRKKVTVRLGALSTKGPGTAENTFVATKVKTGDPGLAYLELGRPTAVKPIDYVFPNPVKDGRSATLVGYGGTADTSAGTLRQGAFMLVAECPKGNSDYPPGDVICTKGRTTKNGKTIGDPTACGGDEGAPLFQSGRSGLIGIVDHRSATCKKGGLAGYIALSNQKDFMAEALLPRLSGRAFDATKAEPLRAKQGEDGARISSLIDGAIIKAYGPGHVLVSSIRTFNLGTYTLPLARGTYSIEVSAPGFQTRTTDGVVVKGPQPFDAGLSPDGGCTAGGCGGDVGEAPESRSSLRAVSAPSWMRG